MWAQKNSDGLVPLQEAIRNNRHKTVRFVMQRLDEGAYEPYTVCNRFDFLLRYALSAANADTVKAVSEGCNEGIYCSSNFTTLLRMCRDALFTPKKEDVKKLLLADIFFKVRHVSDCTMAPFDPIKELVERLTFLENSSDADAKFEILDLLIAHFNCETVPDDPCPRMREIKDANKRVSDELVYTVIDRGDDLRLFTTLVRGLPDRMTRFKEVRLHAFESLALSKGRSDIACYIRDWALGHHSPWD
ncbi:hypothetical protein CYMTET_44672 [Cymbomonas tetramitiformis]|uniref:Uncharacterized protein n=1 Tax=Cymbomonas tetramitiformis TaxID=36881 RepID=A0AAE0BZV8_9CHLO|nr:hypothetical protein CYMTET_44672 [Cymbomonas tetramitiformis]